MQNGCRPLLPPPLVVSVRTVYGFINAGDLAVFRMGRVIKVRRSDLDSFIESCRVQPGDLTGLQDAG